MTTSRGPVGDAAGSFGGLRLSPSNRAHPVFTNRSRRATFALYSYGLVLTDTALTGGVAIAAILIMGPDSPLLSFVVLAGAVLSIALVANRTRSKRVLGTGAREYTRLIVACLSAFGLLAICMQIADVKDARSMFTALLPIETFVLIFGRTVWRLWFVLQRIHGHHLSRTVVIGLEAEVLALGQRLAADPEQNFQIVGFVVDDWNADELEIDGHVIPVFPTLSTVSTIVRATRADLVVVTGQRAADHDFVRELSWSLEDAAVDLALASGLDDVADARVHVESVGGIPLMHLEIPTFEGAKHVVKRVFDVAVVTVALVVLAPVFVAIAIAVKTDSQGPALFRQVRVGKNGRNFGMLKFRSMVQSAEQELTNLMDVNEGAGVLFKMKKDPRVTRVGSFLRKYSLDELPQLWNILVGDMSVVGPRPPLPREVSQYEAHVNRRLYIKPGLTGLWQVSGRSDLSWDESVSLDLYYVANWSLGGDISIMFRTVRVLLNSTGAY